MDYRDKYPLLSFDSSYDVLCEINVEKMIYTCRKDACCNC